ncbi:MAG TPA: DinB family protein, partial [Mycobacterium sp.]|nr:DinB family protein [Mycobacterium sp.]
RVRLMLDEDEPRFPNRDQDDTALADDYGAQDPAAVATELFDAAAVVADTYDSVPPESWSRRGLRSNGSEFTVASIAVYHLHDIVHHANDVDG